MAVTFEDLIGGGGGGSSGDPVDGEVTNYSALPSAASVTGQVYRVLEEQGTWFLGTLKRAGDYYSNGSTWTHLGSSNYLVKAYDTSTADNALVRYHSTDGQSIQECGVVVDDSNNMSGINNLTLSGTVDGRDVATDGTKLDGIEAGADVTDATNVDAAGAVMNSDTSTASMSFVIDEDTMSSDSATKVPTQQSVKAYVDANGGGVSGGMNFYNGNYLSHVDSTGFTSGAFPTTDQLYFVPINIEKSATFTKIGINITTGGSSGAVCRLGLYELASDGNPGALLVDGGTVDTTTTGEKEVTISQTLAGKYYIAFTLNNGTGATRTTSEGLTMWYGQPSGSTSSSGTYLYASSYAPTSSLPDPAPSVSLSTSLGFGPYVRK